MSGAKEKRRSARIPFRPSDGVQVHYKFLSHLPSYQCETIFRGSVLNLSKGGVLFSGPIPGPEWLSHLGQGEILIGMNLIGRGDRIKALASLRWTRPAKSEGSDSDSGEVDPTRGPEYELGVQFEQLDPAHRRGLSRLLIGHQLRTRKLRPSQIHDLEGY
ncbi:MAG: PilZ domain-containing protein [Planctomycetes bacterium]|nr:PilZ domain-containing protein [Planctomycetota bacterium]